MACSGTTLPFTPDTFEIASSRIPLIFVEIEDYFVTSRFYFCYENDIPSNEVTAKIQDLKMTDLKIYFFILSGKK